MSSCHKKDISNNVISITNVTIERMTLNDSCHKHAYKLQVKCYRIENLIKLEVPLGQLTP